MSLTLTLQPQLRCKNLIAAAAAAAAGGAAPPAQQEVCNGLVQEVEEEDPTVNEDDPNSDPLHPFACSRCGERFNAMKAKDVHEVECAKKIVVGDAVYIKGMPSIVYHVMAIENEDQARLMSTSTGIYQHKLVNAVFISAQHSIEGMLYMDAVAAGTTCFRASKALPVAVHTHANS
eukprot:16548-Heterococcus_DN1.PRE.1